MAFNLKGRLRKIEEIRGRPEVCRMCRAVNGKRPEPFGLLFGPDSEGRYHEDVRQEAFWQVVCRRISTSGRAGAPGEPCPTCGSREAEPSPELAAAIREVEAKQAAEAVLREAEIREATTRRR